MKVFDRYDGIEVELPRQQVEPGRYRLLTATRLNRAVELVAGDVLWSDGSARCVLSSEVGESVHDFALPPDEADGREPNALIDDAIDAVVEQWRGGPASESGADRALPSPVMPAKLGEKARLNSLETRLQQTLDAGYLHTIAQRPRMEMRYDIERLPVSRAKRVAHGAGVRLAAHSEDWACREITGVVPSHLLAEVSEDELGIYENLVFARLLDRLARVLRRRQRELKMLLAKQDEVGHLRNAQTLDYRLREALCRLWGQAFDVDESAEGRAALQAIERLLGQIRQLQRSEVAQVVAGRVPSTLTLRSTNILQHDPHYRHLRPLWQLAHADLNNRPRTAAERVEWARHRADAHAEHVGLLIRHALESIRTYYDRPVKLVRHGLDWAVEFDLLEIPVPRLWFVSARHGSRQWLSESAVSGQEGRHVVFSHPVKDTVGGQVVGADGVLNPLEFYGVERIQQAIDRWLMQYLLQGYPFEVHRVPEALQRNLSRHFEGVWVRRASALAMIRPLSADKRRKCWDLIGGSAANEQTRQSLHQAMLRMELLAQCRACGKDGAEWSVSEGSFKTRCGCGQKAVWRCDATGPYYCLGEKERPFSEVGHFALHL